MATQTIDFGGARSYTLDEYGYLYPPRQWDEAFAEGMARRERIATGLSDEHWSFIRYLRQKFIGAHEVPLLVHACADNRLRLGRLKHLFPTGYHRGACRIAGINYEFMSCTSRLHAYETPPVPLTRHRIAPNGFLERFDDWDESFAADVAREWQLPTGLTERHREVLRFLRARYAACRSVPTVYETCEHCSLDLDELQRLFPDGYRRGACRMAGLPFFP